MGNTFKNPQAQVYQAQKAEKNANIKNQRTLVTAARAKTIDVSKMPAMQSFLSLNAASFTNKQQGLQKEFEYIRNLDKAFQGVSNEHAAAGVIELDAALAQLDAEYKQTVTAEENKGWLGSITNAWNSLIDTLCPDDENSDKDAGQYAGAFNG